MFCPSMVAVTPNATACFYGRVRAPVSLIHFNDRKEEQLNDSGTTDNSKAVIEEKNRRTAPINKYTRHKTRKPITVEKGIEAIDGILFNFLIHNTFYTKHNSNTMVYKHRNPINTNFTYRETQELQQLSCIYYQIQDKMLNNSSNNVNSSKGYTEEITYLAAPIHKYTSNKTRKPRVPISVSPKTHFMHFIKQRFETPEKNMPLHQNSRPNRKEEQLNDSGTTDNSKAVIEEKNRRTAPINKYTRHKTRKPITVEKGIEAIDGILFNFLIHNTC
ncbi:hypothetical protein AGLY_015292 [Aphis glycines]|uniref:Uncharacterized protein n=1 Tax=Aphis glycines TaxID=307491 RepID=A0A6G0T0U6_APHGL|nr:hypothetical protein AGLY_015292 [Aphis glycines]